LTVLDDHGSVITVEGDLAPVRWSQVTSEGGMEAAMEAPFVYAALDALASRAASWAERRQRRLLESAVPAVAATMQEPEEAATMMAAAVKKVQMVKMPRILPLCLGSCLPFTVVWQSLP
jgi:hypothetical protein